MKKNTLISTGFLGATSVVSVFGYGLTAYAAGLTPVSLELAIVIDGSASIAEQDFNNQITVLNNIFNDPNFYNDFVLPLKGLEVQDHTTRDPNAKIVIDDPSLAVGIFQFGGEFENNVAGETIFEKIVDWTVFNEQHQSGIGQLNPSNIDKAGGFTPISDILKPMIDEFSNNNYDGRRVVNISSDGFETFSSNTLLNSTQEAFLSGVTFNALVVPALGLQTERSYTSNEDTYDLQVLKLLVDRYPAVRPQYKNNNLVGNPAFIMEDYVTGEKTLEEAFRLKLGLETIGRAPTPRPSVDDSGTDSTNSTGGGTGAGTDPTDSTGGGTGAGTDPTNSTGGGTGAGTDPTNSTGGGTGVGTDPTNSTGGGTGTITEPEAENIPEPSSLLGLLAISLLGLLRHKKKA